MAKPSSPTNLASTIIYFFASKKFPLIRHHFLRDHVLKGDCALEFVDTKNQLADIFTKPLSKETFFAIRRELGLLDVSDLDK